jgi:hypothetical protein
MYSKRNEVHQVAILLGGILRAMNWMTETRAFDPKGYNSSYLSFIAPCSAGRCSLNLLWNI